MANMYTKSRPDMNRMISLYESGMTQYEVAKEMGITQKVVWRCLRDSVVKCRKAAARNQKGSVNNNWQGNDVTYAALHKRVEAIKGKPKLCEVCGLNDEKRMYHWANLTGQYENPDDYKRMCCPCHWKYDKSYLNVKGSYKGRK